jgi:hypothetical protein
MSVYLHGFKNWYLFTYTASHAGITQSLSLILILEILHTQGTAEVVVTSTVVVVTCTVVVLTCFVMCVFFSVCVCVCGFF